MKRKVGTNWRGIHALNISLFAFAIMDAAFKELSYSYPPMQVVGLRGLSCLPFAFLFLVSTKTLPKLFEVNWRIQSIRWVLALITLWSLGYASKQMSLAQLYTIYFLSPICLVAIAAVFLREKTYTMQRIALLLGVVGVVVAYRPAIDTIETWSTLAAFAMMLSYAVGTILARIQTKTDDSSLIVFWTLAGIGVFGAFLALPQWQAIEVKHYWLIGVLAIFGFAAQYFWVNAVRYCTPTALAPFEYIAFVWVILLDYLVWGIIVDWLMLIGAGIIIVAGLLALQHNNSVDSFHP